MKGSNSQEKVATLGFICLCIALDFGFVLLCKAEALGLYLPEHVARGVVLISKNKRQLCRRLSDNDISMVFCQQHEPECTQMP